MASPSPWLEKLDYDKSKGYIETDPITGRKTVKMWGKKPEPSVSTQTISEPAQALPSIAPQAPEQIPMSQYLPEPAPEPTTPESIYDKEGMIDYFTRTGSQLSMNEYEKPYFEEIKATIDREFKDAKPNSWGSDPVKVREGIEGVVNNPRLQYFFGNSQAIKDAAREMLTQRMVKTVPSLEKKIKEREGMISALQAQKQKIISEGSMWEDPTIKAMLEKQREREMEMLTRKKQLETSVLEGRAEKKAAGFIDRAEAYAMDQIDEITASNGRAAILNFGTLEKPNLRVYNLNDLNDKGAYELEVRMGTKGKPYTLSRDRTNAESAQARFVSPPTNPITTRRLKDGRVVNVRMIGVGQDGKPQWELVR